MASASATQGHFCSFFWWLCPSLLHSLVLRVYFTLSFLEDSESFPGLTSPCSCHRWLAQLASPRHLSVPLPPSSSKGPSLMVIQGAFCRSQAPGNQLGEG